MHGPRAGARVFLWLGFVVCSPALAKTQRSAASEILQQIVLQHAAREPANWDEWLIRPSDSGYSMMLTCYASKHVYTEASRTSNEDRAYVNARSDDAHLILQA